MADDITPVTELASIDSIADNLSQNMPDVQPHAIDHERAQNQQKTDQFGELRDKDGNAFDPQIHRTDKDGNPVLSAKDKLIRKPGRKSGSAAPPRQSVIADAPGQSPAEITARDDMQMRAAGMALGKVAANTMISICTLISDEWKPTIDEEHGIDERQYLENAFGEYFVATGKTDLPPSWGLGIAISAYAIPRFGKPKTKSRLAQFGSWIKKKYINWKLRKTGLVVSEKNKSHNETD